MGDDVLRPVFEGVDEVMFQAVRDDAAALAKFGLPTSNTIVLKFAEGTGVQMPSKERIQIDEELFRPQDFDKTGLRRDVLEKDVVAASDLLAQAPRITVDPLFDRPPVLLQQEKIMAEATLDQPVGDGGLYHLVTVDDARSDEVERVLSELSALESVELAYLAPVPFEASVDIAPATPAIGGQGYLEPAPGGIDARYAWRVRGGRGASVRIIDVEGAWKLDHEDLPRMFFDGSGINPFNWFREDHGTAVLGELGAPDNNYGVVGIVPEAALGVCTWARLGLLPAALDNAAAQLGPGDVLLIEVHYPGPTSNLLRALGENDETGFVPVEHLQAEFDAIRRITARGIIVVEAAGNGGMNLDDTSVFGQRFNRFVRDSGAILVGAGDPTTHAPLDFSNNGARVDVQGWGQGVTTLGYGDVTVPGAESDKRQWYTMTFRGTSSASPIVAGAAAAIQGACRANGRSVQTPQEMRLLLVETGTQQQGDPPHIGPLPNLHAALDRLGIQPAPPPGWPELGGPLLSAPAVESNQDGRMEVVGLGPDGGVWHTWQTLPSNGWAVWSSMRGGLPAHMQLVGRPAIVRNFDARLEVFALGSDMAIWHIWQTGPNAGWSGWESLGGRCASDPAVEINDNGRLEIFVRWEDGSLHHQWQRLPNAFWSGWHGMGGDLAGPPAAGHSSHRRIEVFVRGTDGQLWHIYQVRPGGEWGDWVGPSGNLTGDPVVGHTGLGAQTRMEVFALAPGNQLVLTYQTAPNNGWSGLQPFGGQIMPGSRCAVTTDREGRLRLFARWRDGSIVERHHLGGPPWWSEWFSLGGNLNSDPAAGMNADGRAEVFAQGSNGQLVHRWEPFA